MRFGLLTGLVIFIQMAHSASAAPISTTPNNAPAAKQPITGTGAGGEAQTAVMDQNGRWHVVEKPKEAPQPLETPPVAKKPIPPQHPVPEKTAPAQVDKPPIDSFAPQNPEKQGTPAQKP